MRPARKRELIDDVRAIWKVSIRRACSAFRFDTSSYHYKSRRPSQASLRERIKAIAQTRVRYGYRRIHVLLRREGWIVNAKRVNRHYRDMGLQLRNKSPKRRSRRSCATTVRLRSGRTTSGPWTSSTTSCYDGRKIRITHRDRHLHAVVPAIEVREASREPTWSPRSKRVAGTGYPKSIRLDKGTGVHPKELDLWAFVRGVELDFSRPGKPTDNAFIESLNGKFRAECLSPTGS